MLQRFYFLCCAVWISPNFIFAIAENCASQTSLEGNIFAYNSLETHQLRVLDDGVAAFKMRLDMIERADCWIDMEYIIYMPDEAGRLLAQALIRKKKAQPSIRIRFLLDAPPPVWIVLDAYHVSELIKHGIEVHYYNPGWNLLHLTHRNHRKLLITEKEALTGGRNIANHYFDLDPLHNFADRDLWIQGKGIAAMQAVFDTYWNSNRVKPAKPILPPTFEQFSRRKVRYDANGKLKTYRGYSKDWRQFQNALRVYQTKNGKALRFVTESKEDSLLLVEMNRLGEHQIQNEPIFYAANLTFLSDKPDWKDKTANVTGATAYPFLNSAQDYIFIENGYFMPQSKERKVLKNLLEDGRDITLLTNSRYASLEFMANSITLRRAKTMMKYGLQVFLYTGSRQPEQLPHPQHGFTAVWNTHAKTMVVDRKDVWIGTMNFDPRSIRRLNAEMAVIIHDSPEFAERVYQLFEQRLLLAYPMDPTERDPRSQREKLQTTRQWFQAFLTDLGLIFAETQF